MTVTAMHMPENIGSIISELTAYAVSYSDSVKYGDYLQYKQVDEDYDGTYDYIEISDCDQSAESVDIPSEIEGLSVTSIGDYAFSGTS